MDTIVFGQHDPGQIPLGENQFGIYVYICDVNKMEYNKYMK
jgi:hypothetical protein